MPRRTQREEDRTGMAMTGSLAFHLGDPRTTARATTEMVFHQEAAAGAQVIAQIRPELRAELRTYGAAGVRDLLPNARSRRLDLAGVHAFRSHLVKCSFQTVFGHCNLLRDRVLAFHFGLQPLPDSVEPDCHVVLFHLEHSGQLFNRQPFDVTEQEQGGIVTVQGGDGPPELLFQQQRRLHSRAAPDRPAPTPHEARVGAAHPPLR